MKIIIGIAIGAAAMYAYMAPEQAAALFEQAKSYLTSVTAS